MVSGQLSPIVKGKGIGVDEVRVLANQGEAVALELCLSIMCEFFDERLLAGLKCGGIGLSGRNAQAELVCLVGKMEDFSGI